MHGFNFPIKVVRTNRKKSATIKLDGGMVKINVPQSLSDIRVRGLIEKKLQWIKTNLKEQSLKPQSKKKEFVDGVTFSYLGKNYKLQIIEGLTPSIKLSQGFLVVTVKGKTSQSKVQSIIEYWYKEKAKKVLTEKTNQLAEKIGVRPKIIFIKNYRSRWGSCSSNGNLSYNWRIIQAPTKIINYVVVHELCHLLEHNHSARYWAHVSTHFPKWKESRDWLKKTNINF